MYFFKLLSKFLLANLVLEQINKLFSFIDSYKYVATI